MAALLIIALGIPIWNIFKALKRGKDSSGHPIVRTLEKYGNPLDVAKGINAEYKLWHKTIGPAVFTQNWLLVTRYYDIYLIPLENQVWAFEKVRGPSVWSELVIVPRERNSTPMGEYLFWARRKQIQQMLDVLQSTRPWLILGWTSQIKSDTVARRPEVIAYVDERRRQHLSGQAIPLQHGACPPPP